MRNLITGGAGFLGSHLVDRLMQNDEEVICLDNYFTGRKSNISKWIGHPNFELIRHDVTEAIKLEVDRIWHLACPASPIHYQFNPIKTAKTSFLGTYNMLGLARRVGARFLLASTSEVYGDPPAEHIPTPETYVGQIPTMGSRSCYDVGKLVIETLSDIFHQERDLPVKIIRPFNLYGPYMRLDDGRMMANLCKSVVENDIMSVYGTGNQTRTYCYVADAILLMIKALLSDENGEVFNVGSNYDEMSALEVCETAYDILGANRDNLRVIEHPSFYPKDEPNRRKADISKVIKAFGNEPKTPFTEGIKRTYQYVEDVYRNSRENFGGEIR